MASPAITGCVALVCGAGSGIGRTIALTLVSRGISVLICGDINLDGVQQTVHQAEALGKSCPSFSKAVAIRADVGKENDVQALFDVAKNQGGRIDICVNTAGFGAGEARAIGDMPLAQYRAQIEVHNVGGFLFLRQALRVIVEQDFQVISNSRYAVRGAIVMLTSLASEGAYKGIANYAAAKFAVKSLVQTAALEYARKGIRINAVAPGYVSGGMMDVWLEQNPAAKEQLLGDSAMGRLVDPEEVAEAVLFLASPSSSMISGHTLVLDGGSSLQLSSTPFTDT